MARVPALRKIAFVVREDAQRGAEIRYASVSLDGKRWLPPHRCDRTNNSEYWRKVFLLVAKFYGRLQTQGPLSQWPCSDGSPILIHEDEPNYEYWRFLAKYWHAKSQDIKRKPRTEESERLRPEQIALARLFRARGSRKSHWISIHGELTFDSIVVCTKHVDFWGPDINGTSPLPEDFFEKRRITDYRDVFSLLERLTTQIRDTEFQRAYHRKPERTWMAAYKGALVSQVPEYPLTLTVQEKTIKTDPQSGKTSISYSSPIYPVEVIPRPGQPSKQILLTGPAGSGKSTLLRLLANEYLQQAGESSLHRLPILVRLCLFDPAVHSTIEDLAVQSVRILLTDAGEHFDKDTESALRKRLERSKDHDLNTFYLMDGYNEIPYEHRFGAHSFEQILGQFLRERHGTVIITTRGEERPVCFSPQIYRLQELDADVVRECVEARLPASKYASYAEQILHDSKYSSLAKNPFFFDLLVQLALDLGNQPSNASAQLPRNRAAVLHAIVERSLHRKFHDEGIQYPQPFVSPPFIISTLSRIAHGILEHPTRRVRFPQSITEIVSDPGTGQSIIRTAVLAGLLEHIDFDSATVDQPIVFSHDLLRDYFAALHIKGRISEPDIDLRTEYLEYHRWDEPLCLLADMCDEQQTFEDIALKIAEDDVPFALQFVLRGLYITPPLVLSLLRGYAFLLEMISNATITCPQGNDEAPTPVVRSVTELFSHQELSHLLKARKTLPDCWLRDNIICTIGMLGGDAWEKAIKDIPQRDHRERALLVKGLSCVNSHDAFIQAMDIVRSTLTLPGNKDADDSRVGFVLDCMSVFPHWRTDLSPNDLLAMIKNEDHLEVRLLLLGELEKVRFTSRHAQDLIQLVDADNPGYCSPVLVALGRIGGDMAIDAILDFTTSLIKIHGDMRTSEITGRNLHVVFDALAATKDPYAALDRLQRLLGCQDLPRKDYAYTGGNVMCAWNRMLVEILNKAKEVVGLSSHFSPQGADEKLTNTLRKIARTHSSGKTRKEAAEALARISCLQDSERTLDLIDALMKRPGARRQGCIKPNTLPGSKDHLLFWAILHFEEVMSIIELNMTDTAISRCVRLAENRCCMLRIRFRCADALIKCGIKPSADLLGVMLEYQFFGVGVGIGIGVEKARAELRIAGISDSDIADFASDIRKSANREKGSAFTCAFFAELASALLDNSERRYLEALGGWPRGLRSVPETYKPVGFDELTRIVTEKRT